MPTYQYACTVPECGHEFERVQAFSDNALTECPECAGRLRKVWGSIGVVFKGSGFYRNDSRSSVAKDGEAATKKTKEAGSGESSSTATSETTTSASKDSAPKATSTSSSKATSGVASAAS